MAALEALPSEQAPAALGWLEGLANGFVKNPLPWFCALLVAAVVWLARQNAKDKEATKATSEQFAALSKDYGATMVRLEHVLAGLTRMRDEYKRQLAELSPPKSRKPADESHP